MAGGIAATTWSLGGADRIDLFWRDDVFAISHVGGDGSKWTSNRIGPLKFVVPEWPDALGGIFTTVPAAAWTLAQPAVLQPTLPPTNPTHHIPVPLPGPAPAHPGSRGGTGGPSSRPPAGDTYGPSDQCLRAWTRLRNVPTVGLERPAREPAATHDVGAAGRQLHQRAWRDRLERWARRQPDRRLRGQQLRPRPPPAHREGGRMDERLDSARRNLHKRRERRFLGIRPARRLRSRIRFHAAPPRLRERPLVDRLAELRRLPRLRARRRQPRPQPDRHRRRRSRRIPSSPMVGRLGLEQLGERDRWSEHHLRHTADGRCLRSRSLRRNRARQRRRPLPPVVGAGSFPRPAHAPELGRTKADPGTRSLREAVRVRLRPIQQLDRSLIRWQHLDETGSALHRIRALNRGPRPLSIALQIQHRQRQRCDCEERRAGHRRRGYRADTRQLADHDSDRDISGGHPRRQQLPTTVPRPGRRPGRTLRARHLQLSHRQQGERGARSTRSTPNSVSTRWRKTPQSMHSNRSASN